ncbi:MAG: hypothetical protein JSS10_05640 [Verrucomicrobia bacterium]|nr:hypothetical protein [Verrucomicrobiota bacterium]
MTIDVAAARNFSQAILQKYDNEFRTDALKSEEDEQEDVDTLAQKTQEYNKIESMTEWYTTVNAFRSYSQKSLSKPKYQEAKILESSAMQFSALDRLNVIKDENEVEPYLLTEGVRGSPLLDKVSPYLPIPFFYFSSPKSELDSLIFQRAFCALSDLERDKIVQEMQQACHNLEPHFFNSQQRIYRLQEVATWVFRNSFAKGIVSTALIAAPTVVILFVITPKIYAVFTKVLTDKWEAIVSQHPYESVVLKLNALYHQARDFNNFTTKTAFRAQAASFVLPQLIAMTSHVSSYAPSVLMKVYYVVYPKLFFGLCANKFVRSFLLKPSLVAFKIFNGTEYKTVQALKERFKNDSIACANALKAHSLWMYLQKRGTPEPTLNLLGYFPTPAA